MVHIALREGGSDMAARSIWRGHLRLSLVMIPVRVYPGTNAAATIRFHQLHRVCQTRVQYKKWCPHCDREVPEDEIVNGYEFERGRYVTIEDKEIEKVRPESTRVIHLDQVADTDALDPALYDEPYYLAPDGNAANDAFAVLRDALDGKVAIGTVAFHRRERLVAIEPRRSGLAMLTLRRAAELRDIEKLDDLKGVPRHAARAEVVLARKLLASLERPLDLSRYPDRYEQALRAMIDRRIAGEEIVETPEVKAPAKVVNLLDALKRSLAQAPARAKRPGKTVVGARRSARVARFQARKRA
jgi:DNA end-binding protein Ku